MKYIKKFESINLIDGLKVGDYVICSSVSHKLDKFLRNNIGLCVEIDIESEPEIPYRIIYDNIDQDLSMYFNYYKSRWFSSDDILFHSSNKEDCEIYLNSKKYNI